MSGDALSPAEYKKLVEARFSNLAGSTYSEVLLLSTSLVTLTVASAIASAFISRIWGETERVGWRRCILDAMFVGITVSFFGAISMDEAVAVPRMAALTVAGGVALFAASLVPPPRVLPAVSSPTRVVHAHPRPQSSSSTTLPPPPSPRRRQEAYFANFRGSLMFMTAYAILAIDFMNFPPRWMKTETFGVSLMDTGVGSFVFSAALAFGAKLAAAAKNGAPSSSSTAAAQFSRAWIGSAVPLLIIGGVRVAIIAATQYQEHVTEYGTHWNFFLTLAVMPVYFLLLQQGVADVNKCCRRQHAAHHRDDEEDHEGNSKKNAMKRFCSRPFLESCSLGLQGCAIGFVYQAWLQPGRLTAWIMGPERRNIVEGNKEGICSSVGYFALFLIGAQVGKWIFAVPGNAASVASERRRAVKGERGNVVVPSTPRDGHDDEDEGDLLRRKAVCAAVIAISAGILTAFLESWVQPCSRRLCNLTYVSFIVCLNTMCLAGFVLAEYALASFLQRLNADRLTVGREEKSSPKRMGEEEAISVVASPASWTLSPTMDSINANQLALFLVANLSTGAVNLSMRTIFAPWWVALLVTSAYLAALCAVAHVWHRILRWKLKVW